MSIGPFPISDMLTTVKSREVQRALLAEMAHDQPAAARHFLAAAHLELVLAEDYTQAGLTDLSLRSRLSAASCFWRAGDRSQAHTHFGQLLHTYPTQATAIRQVIDELEHDQGGQAD